MTVLPTKAAMKRVVEAMQEAGVEIGAVEIGADGAIRVIPKGAKTKAKAGGPKSWD